MQIRKFNVFTLDRILIYLGACFAFPLACFTQAVRYNYFQHHNGLPVGAWAAMTAAMLGFSLGVYRLFWDRYVFKKQVEGYTSDGIMIMKHDYASLLPPQGAMYADLEAATKEVVDFWEVRYPNSGIAMTDLINGASLAFTSQKIELIDPPFSSHVTPTAFKKFAVGITDFKAMLVMAQPTETWDVVIKRFKHELGHVCLTACMDIPDNDMQHAIMAKAGFPY